MFLKENKLVITNPKKKDLRFYDGSNIIVPNEKEFNDFFKSNYKSTNFDTISGLLISKFKGLPKTHDVINIDNYKFQIKISDQRRIRSIQVEVRD